MGKSPKTPAKKTTKRAQSAPGNKDQIGAVNNCIADYLGVSVSKLETALNILASVRYRDSIYAQFKVNRSELWALLSLAGYLSSINKPLTSLNVIIDHLSGTFTNRQKFFGYFQGLIRAGCLGTFEYVHNPGSLSVGITDLGLAVIRAHYSDMNKLFGRYINDGSRQYLSISNKENIPMSYRYREAA